MVAKVNRDQFFSVGLPGSSDRVLLTPAGQLENGNFLDPSGKQQLKVDHLTQKCTGVSPLSAAEMSTFAGAAAFIDTVLDDCRRDGCVTTILGRRRTISGVRPRESRRKASGGFSLTLHSCLLVLP